MLVNTERKIKEEMEEDASEQGLDEGCDLDDQECLVDDEGSPTKKARVNEEDKVQKCRERNRIHARNTRERKRAQMDLLQQRIQDLSEEKKQLEEYEPEVSVASILMSLSSCSKLEDSCGESKTSIGSDAVSSGTDTRTFAADAIERIRTQIAAVLSDDEELELGSEFQLRDKTQCTTQELETIRRERNRMHAKKTRLRKKKMLSEMETIISTLEQEIRELKRKHNLLPVGQDGAGNERLNVRPPLRSTKFTGFRHMQNRVYNGVTTISGLRVNTNATAVPAPVSTSTTFSTSARPAPLALVPPAGSAPSPKFHIDALGASRSGPAQTQQGLLDASLLAPMPLQMVLSMFPFPQMTPGVASASTSTGLQHRYQQPAVSAVAGTAGAGTNKRKAASKMSLNRTRSDVSSASGSSSGGAGTTTNSSSSSASPTNANANVNIGTVSLAALNEAARASM